MSSNPSRVPAGVRTGGQFAAAAKAESAVALNPTQDAPESGAQAAPEPRVIEDVRFCPSCAGSGTFGRTECGYCEGDGYVSPTEYEDYVADGGEVRDPGYQPADRDFYVFYDPDYEGMVEARDEEKYETRGRDVEWAGEPW